MNFLIIYGKLMVIRVKVFSEVSVFSVLKRNSEQTIVF